MTGSVIKQVESKSAGAEYDTNSAAIDGKSPNPQEGTGEAGPQVVVLEYSDLESGKDLTSEIKQAFGEGGIGLCAVAGVPNLDETRRNLLPLAQKLGQLPPDVLSQYERAETHYCYGWSRGREKFKGKADVSKGSWYNNPIWDDPADGDEAVISKFAACASKNIWPSELPELEPAFKALGKIMYTVAQPILKQCDNLVQSVYPEHRDDMFRKTFPESRLVAGRLLHYYPTTGESWCGWHNDNSVITGLVQAMWLNDETHEEVEGICSEAGLHVCSRSGKVEKVSVPKGCLLFQVGEAAQIMSGGVLRATPHYVRGHASPPGEMQISRETFAMFIEPNWDSLIGPPKGATIADIFRDEETQLIPPLSTRFHPDPETHMVEFGKLLGDSFVEYYKHNNS